MYRYQRIRDCREDKDWTQAQVAEYLGIDQRTYSNYETGRRGIPVHLLIALSKLYGVSVDYLVSVVGDPLPRKKNRKKPGE